MSDTDGSPARGFVTDAGIPLDRDFFEAADVPEAPAAPGTFPFTRGIDEGMYRRELWHRDLYAGFGNAEDAKGRFESLMASGASGINIALDLPTQVGLDSDAEDARGEVGRVGLAVDSLRDLEHLLDGIDLRQARTIFTVANGVGPILAAMFIAAAEHQGCPETDFVLHLQNDPLKEFTGRGAFVFPVDPSVKLAADVVEYAVRRGNGHWKPIGVCGSQFRWGGGSAVQEIAFGIASARVYLDELLSRGLDIDDVAPLMELHLAADNELFEEVAKFRAARRVWARLMREEYGAQRPESLHLRVSLYTAGYRLTKQQPLNNSVRVTMQALAAVLGGVQHIGTLSIDEALSTPSPEAAALAVATQNILAYESKVGDVADPLGGSYYVEWLTDQLDRRMSAELARVTNEGGAMSAIRSGEFQRIVQDLAYSEQLAIESGERVIVGVNAFIAEGDGASTIDPFLIHDESEKRQISRLEALRRDRDGALVDSALARLEAVARSGENVMPVMLEAVKAYATIGEICASLRAVHGSWETEGSLL